MLTLNRILRTEKYCIASTSEIIFFFLCNTNKVKEETDRL